MLDAVPRGPVSLCGGGTASAKPGFQVGTVFTAAAIEAMITIAGFPEIAAAVAPLLQTTVVNLNTICASDPEPYPNFGADDLFKLVTMADPLTWLDTLAMFQQWFRRIYWCLACECENGTTPNCGTPSNPGTVGQNQGLPSGQAGAACYSASSNFAVPPATVATPPYVDCTALLPGAATQAIPAIASGGGAPSTGKLIPTGVSVITFNGTATGSPSEVTAVLQIANSVPQNLAVIQVAPFAGNTTGSATWTRSIPLPSGATAWSLFILPYFSDITPQVGVASITIDFSYTCTPNPNTPNTPCCPPDPALDYKLTQILNLLLHDRTAPVNQYTRGTTHTGVTGTGTLTVSNLFGVLVEITQGVPTNPQLPGVPPYEWSVGWISMLTADGMIDEIRLTRQAQVWASRIAPYATIVGYQLNAGFVANITELLPVSPVSLVRP